MNVVTLVGNLTKDSEVRTFDNGGAVTTFSVALNDSYKNKAGEWVEQTTFIDCKYFKERNLEKGVKVSIVGKLEKESWTDRQSGDQRSKVIVKVQNVRKLSYGSSANQGSDEPAF